MKGSTSYVYRIVATTERRHLHQPGLHDHDRRRSQHVPKLTATITNAAAHDKGFIVTSTGLSGTARSSTIPDGAPVWWATSPSAPSRIQMSWDGSKMYMMALNVQNTGSGRPVVDMDGSNAARSPA